VIADVPSHFATAVGGVVYTPRNYDGRYRGPLRIRSALAGSENVPAVAMLSKVGVPSLLRLLRNAGFTNLDKTADYYGLGLTLGGAEVSLEQLVRAYAVFARGGERVVPTMLLGAEQKAQPRLLSQRSAFLITDVLTDADAREFIFGRGGSLDFPFPVAVKTGTSQSYRDNWVIGYTRDVTVGVWVGNFDRTELRNSTGVTGAGPIFNGVMFAAMKRARGTLPIGDQTAIVEPTSDVESVPVCTVSGTRPSTWCPTVRNEWVPAAAPVEFCSWHRDGHTEWPDQYRGWARAHGLLHEVNVAAPSVMAASAGTPTARRESLRVTSPADGATFLIDPTLRMEFQKLPLRATARTALTWHVDDRKFASVRRDSAAEWPLEPGRHTITAIDAEGRRDSVTIYVK
jgi:penicillin-binding protein 1C